MSHNTFIMLPHMSCRLTPMWRGFNVKDAGNLSLWELFTTSLTLGLYNSDECRGQLLVTAGLGTAVSCLPRSHASHLPLPLLRFFRYAFSADNTPHPLSELLSWSGRCLVEALSQPIYCRKKKKRIYTCQSRKPRLRPRDPSRWPRGTLYPQKLVLISPTSGGRSVGTVRSRTQATECFSLV
jgi:hypothetical protein